MKPKELELLHKRICVTFFNFTIETSSRNILPIFYSNIFYTFGDNTLNKPFLKEPGKNGINLATNTIEP
jgi:hypothetical protein